MKIGELSKRTGVSRDTIRYYVNRGILLPETNRAQYNFTERELHDLQVILRMKQQQFNLKEIQDYISLCRLSNLIEPETIDECLRMMNNKKQELQSQIAFLKGAITSIDQEILELTGHVHGKPQRTGVPLSALPLLVCPRCGQQLEVSHADLNTQNIFSGDLTCKCGYCAKIENGIVKTGKLYTGTHDQPDLRRGLYRNMGNAFMTDLEKCYGYISEELQKMDTQRKVILEANINGYFFLYNYMRKLSPDCLCIIVDKYPEMLEMYKSLIDLLNLNQKILYIADADTDYPLAPGCVDIHVSFFGENEHQFYHKNCFLYDAKRYFSDKAIILGSLLSYPLNSETHKLLRKKYPEGSEVGYNLTALKGQYRKQNYKLTAQKVGSIQELPLKQYAFECHVNGETLEFYHFKAEPMALPKKEQSR
ncbi:MAG: MerR family transcriptional regulator [Clostridiales bacterium]|nr:MerR family transcriptional regulator [Clostridiales bacterium]MCI1960824.1 MerR family transcriptional regulator [Clostridiales bacterium]MCI2021265.1 MerR family transcriptional regulator [Clostridiales bacterium]MCI2025648.1 MerR family transcriptional regulator [Clostridiales bacterium]